MSSEPKRNESTDAEATYTQAATLVAKTSDGLNPSVQTYGDLFDKQKAYFATDVTKTYE